MVIHEYNYGKVSYGWEKEFEENVIFVYAENAIMTNDVPADLEIASGLTEFLHELASANKSSVGDRYEYCDYTDKEYDLFYEEVVLDYYNDIYKDIRLFAQSNHICLYTMDRIMNLPTKEVW